MVAFRHWGLRCAQTRIDLSFFSSARHPPEHPKHQHWRAGRELNRGRPRRRGKGDDGIILIQEPYTGRQWSSKNDSRRFFSLARATWMASL